MIINVIDKNFFLRIILIFFLINYRFSKNNEIFNINMFNIYEMRFIFNI